MSNLNDKRVLNAILNPNTPFEEEKENNQGATSKYEQSSTEIEEAKKLEVEGVKSAEANNLERSIECFSLAIEKAPEWASSYNNRAQAYRLSGDTNSSSTSETLESLTEKHRKEKKDLQSKIQSLKKSVTKGDRKKKKEIDTEIEKLEKEFEEKCQLELKNLTGNLAKPIEKTEKPIEDDLLLAENSPENTQTKQSKSKKRKEKKEKNEQEREKLIAQQEIENKKGPAAVELNKIKEKLKKKGLKIKDVISDGNCMYYAVSDQLQKCSSIGKTCQELRNLTCEYMLKKPDEFQPYVTTDDGDILDLEKYEEYCNKIKNPTVWGGQLELKALSDVLNVLIEVIQAEGSEIIIGEENKLKEKLIITYHRHMFGTGEHYNSTEPEIPKSDDE